MITILDEGFGFGDEVVDEVGDFADDSKSAQGSLRFVNEARESALG